MATTRTAWHPPFTALLAENCPKAMTVRSEVAITQEPLRIDDLIEIITGAFRDPSDLGHTLLGLWKEIQRIGLLEFKSIARPLRRGDLCRLLAYGLLYRASHASAKKPDDAEAIKPVVLDDITLILAVPEISSVLLSELTELGMSLLPSETGYHRVSGCPMKLLVINVTVVAEIEDDDRLRWFGKHGIRTARGVRWVLEHTHEGDNTMAELKDLEGYEEMLSKFLATMSPEQRLAGLAPEQVLATYKPEQVLATYKPEQRLAGLAPEQAILALPDVALGALSGEYLATLPEEVQASVRARLAAKQ